MDINSLIVKNGCSFLNFKNVGEIDIASLKFETFHLPYIHAIFVLKVYEKICEAV